MQYVIVGLGNPGGEYTHTRHNAGRLIVEHVQHAFNFSALEYKKSADALVAKGMIAGKEAVLVLPETYMNDSGCSVAKFIKSQKAAEQLVVIHDDLDLPLGTWKISFDRGEGGHNGLRSITAVLKTKAFIRVRIGILPKGTNEKPKKPKGEEAVLKFVLGKWSPTEREVIDKVTSEVTQALPLLLEEGLEKVMNQFN
jgi:PTH1 family peptidyl-tRNA hydrolase